MIAIEQELVKKFLKKLGKPKDYEINKEKILEILTNGYKDEGLNFHEVFLRSRAVLNLDIDIIDDLFKNLTFINNDDKKRIFMDFEFIKHCRRRYELYQNIQRKIIKNSRGKLYAEDLLLFFEFLNENFRRNGELFLNMPVTSWETGSSQKDHICDSFDVVIKMICELNIPFSQNVASRINKSCNEMYGVSGHQKSIAQFLDAMLVRLNVPTFNGKIWIIYHGLEYWTDLERYRDLNYNYQLQFDIGSHEAVQLMKNVELLEIYGDNEIAKFDFSKIYYYSAKETFYQSYKHLYPVYRDTDTAFQYNGKEYLINDLITIYEKLYAFTEKERGRNDEKDFTNNHSLIKQYGKKQLLRVIGINNNEMLPLLDLLSYDFDINRDKYYLIHCKPLLKKGPIFYIIPSHIQYLSREKVVDKILSNEVTVIFKENEKKGLVFEDSIEGFFRNQNTKFGRVQRNRKQNIPEIDGVFCLDDYVFLFEAKATIKPDSVVESYNYLRDTMLSAQSQLNERINIILNDEERRKYIEDVLKFEIKSKKIAAFILVNHHFFNGYKELKNEHFGVHYPIVDFLTLKNVIINKRALCWNYNALKECYYKTDLPINNGEDLWNYLLNQVECLKSTENPVFQILEDGIAFRIVKPFSFCRIHRDDEEGFSY
ncbi:hypothetical protein [Geosporobacter ferrireducens]|uniref:NERD domain-containing protein n=1 Tax=Geosporobacter ferrireducens TaxID=1424294 RepID=A0A1D8GLX2_9FIRM|nr:hypothetical protein [Geosporobacter ferrireducens]AOT71909.1 hypothetical protein Gferi_21645 [Geosporobacter ferrireducens]MTI55700.1 hypothetical protein [Geosporobacter ferrireducens]